MEGTTIKDALAAEAEFFRINATYAPMASKCGVPYLCRNLNEVIIKHIKKCLPLIRSKITSLLYSKEKELALCKVSKGAAN